MAGTVSSVRGLAIARRSRDLAGIGFTVALLIADLTFAGARLEEAKVGILVASVSPLR